MQHTRHSTQIIAQCNITGTVHKLVHSAKHQEEHTN